MVTFTTDDYFHIGQMHLIRGKPCQDYAFSSVYGPIGFAVVSDGCSGGRYTDIGSRVMALSTAASIRRYVNNSKEVFIDSERLKDSISCQQETIIKITRESLDLELDDMLATCGYICLNEVGGFIHLRGDGAIAMVERSGDMKLISYRWDKNTPLYPAYVEDNYKRFIDFHGGDSSAPALKIEYWKYGAAKTLEKESEQTVSIADGIRGTFHRFSSQEIQQTAFAAVFTDGVMQFGNISDGGNNFLDWKEVVVQLMAFKNSTGEFAKRRIIRFLKDQQKNGKLPLDDIAYAVVKISTEEGD